MNPNDTCFVSVYNDTVRQRLNTAQCQTIIVWRLGVTYFGTREVLEKMIADACPIPPALSAVGPIIKERPFSENLIYRYDGAGRQLGLRKNAKRN